MSTSLPQSPRRQEYRLSDREAKTQERLLGHPLDWPPETWAAIINRVSDELLISSNQVIGGIGGITALGESEVTGSAAATIDVTLTGSAQSLIVVGSLRGDTAANVVNVLLRFNSDSGANYDYRTQEIGGAVSTNASGQTSAIVGTVPANTGVANAFGALRIEVPDYLNTSRLKAGTSQSSAEPENSVRYGGFAWSSTSAITSVTLLAAAGNLDVGSNIQIYGLG